MPGVGRVERSTMTEPGLLWERDGSGLAPFGNVLRQAEPRLQITENAKGR